MPTDVDPTRANRIADAVEEIERNVTRLREYQRLSRGEYLAPDAQDRRDAAERKFEKLVAATIDAGSEICKIERGSVPERRKEVIAALESEGIVDPDLGERLRNAVGFRDVLAHAYGPVVNDDIVYDAIQHDLDRFVEFVTAVDAYLQR